MGTPKVIFAERTEAEKRHDREEANREYERWLKSVHRKASDKALRDFLKYKSLGLHGDKREPLQKWKSGYDTECGHVVDYGATGIYLTAATKGDAIHIANVLNGYKSKAAEA